MQFSNSLVIIMLKYFVAGLISKSSPTKASAEGDDYALTFAKKASNVNLLMEKGADVKFEGDVDNINAEYVSSGSGKCIELII